MLALTPTPLPQPTKNMLRSSQGVVVAINPLRSAETFWIEGSPSSFNKYGTRQRSALRRPQTTISLPARGAEQRGSTRVSSSYFLIEARSCDEAGVATIAMIAAAIIDFVITLAYRAVMHR